MTIDYRVKDGEKLGIPSFMTEFGQGNLEDVLNKTYTYKQSWLFWGYKSFGKNWGSVHLLQEDEEMVNGINNLLSPTYMQLTAGELVQENYDFKTHNYFAVYNAAPGGKSILYLNKNLNYPNGFEV